MGEMLCIRVYLSIYMYARKNQQAPLLIRAEGGEL